jgi:hypothetical protein
MVFYTAEAPRPQACRLLAKTTLLSQEKERKDSANFDFSHTSARTITAGKGVGFSKKNRKI